MTGSGRLNPNSRIMPKASAILLGKTDARTESDIQPRRGFVLFAVTISIFVLLGVGGLGVDIGRMYIAKSEAQGFSDAAALSGAVKLNGTSSGISAAQTAVTQAAGLSWNFGTDRITTPQVDFATNVNGPWSGSPSAPAGYTHVRVRTTVPVKMYLLRALINQVSATVGASAVAAQVAITHFEQGLGPYTVVSTDTTSTNLGLVVGNQYTIQWPQYNGTRHGCSPATPLNCFNSPPCSGDAASSASAVSQYWSASINGYWGSSNNSEIAQEVLDLTQLHPISLGESIILTTGNKNSQAGVLDDRVNQDLDVLDNTVSAYLSNSARNGRRLIALPIVKPGASGTSVTGFGSFLLLSNSSHSTYYSSGTGNDPFCAVYVGPYVQGSPSAGAATGTGAFRVMLVQ
jgi:Flp pilus assembly protein TadG